MKESRIPCNPGLCDTDGWGDGGSTEYRDTSGVWRGYGGCEEGGSGESFLTCHV